MDLDDIDMKSVMIAGIFWLIGVAAMFRLKLQIFSSMNLVLKIMTVVIFFPVCYFIVSFHSGRDD